MITYIYNKFCSTINNIYKHPNENNMTYLQHFNHAIKMSGKLAYASIAVFSHAIYPPIHEKTASSIISDLYFENLKRQQPDFKKN